MGMVLVIAEKPSVAANIAKTLGAYTNNEGYMEGSGYVVSFAFGHLCEYAGPEAYNENYKKWNREDLPIFPEKWKLTVSSDKKQQFDILKDLLNRDDIDYVVNACDAGREGELIFHFVYKMAKSKLPIKRLWISSMESDAIRDGFRHLKDSAEYEGLKQAAIARSKADWLVGINGTRLFTTLYNGTLLKVGRVQSPTLAMIVERDQAIESFTSEPFYTIKLQTKDFEATSDRFHDKDTAEAALTLTKGEKATVTKVSTETKKSQPPKLYDLTSLQRDANRIYGMTAKETLDATQSLYEKKLATYPRTDSRYLTNDMKETAEAVMYSVFDTMIKANRNSFRPDASKLLNSKKVSDHHAIIPTTEIEKCDMDSLSDKEKKILYLIAFRLLSAAADHCEYTVSKVELKINDLLFKASGKHTDKAGYKEYEDLLRQAFKTTEKNDKSDIGEGTDDEDISEGSISDLKEGQIIGDYETSLAEGKTKPPARYTEDTLLSAMEKAGAKETDPEAERKGIGTPATRADIIEKLITDQYVTREKKNLVATPLGIKLVSILPEELKSAELTAEWENDLTLIAKGEAYHEEFLGAIENMVRELIETHTEPNPGMIDLFPAKGGKDVIGECPHCGKPIINGKYGPFCEGKCGISLTFAYGKKLTTQQIGSLLSGKKTLIKGFKSKKDSGKEYDAYLTLKSTEPYTYTAKDGTEKNGVRPVYDMDFPKKKKAKRKAG